MNFNTIEFLFLFLPAAVACHYLAPASFRLPLVLAFSCLFYALSGLVPFIFMLASIVWVYAAAPYIERSKTRFGLLVAVVPPLLILYLFKYLNFTLDTVDASQGTREHLRFITAIVLPAGISFYTFEVVSYLLDVRDRRIKAERSFTVFAAFVAFFPHLIAGPIMRYNQLAPQLARMGSAVPSADEVYQGLKLIAVGLFCKTFFSDVLQAFHDPARALEQPHFLDSLFSVFSYSLIIYYDFWAYSVIAIGLAKLFGIDLPRNFLEPYKSLNPRDFWRRWHVTLSYWLRDYVYLKMGGNQRYVRNIIIVFLAVGLWHGAGWNFVVWGAYHAALVLGYHATRPFWDRLPWALQIGLTFGLVSFGWPLFYLSLPKYWDLIVTIASFNWTTAPAVSISQWVFLLVIGVITFATKEDQWLFNSKPRAVLDNPYALATTCFAAVLFFKFSRTFIYFQF